MFLYYCYIQGGLEKQAPTELLILNLPVKLLFMRESSYCFQRVLAIAILSVRHTGG